jgi:hypothetical protein
MENNNLNLIYSPALANALIGINKFYHDCQNELANLIEDGKDLGTMEEDLDKAFVSAEMVISRLITVSSVAKAEEIALKLV